LRQIIIIVVIIIDECDSNIIVDTDFLATARTKAVGKVKMSHAVVESFDECYDLKGRKQRPRNSTLNYPYNTMSLLCF